MAARKCMGEEAACKVISISTAILLEFVTTHPYN